MCNKQQYNHEAMFHHLFARNKYYFDAHIFIGQQMNEMSLETGSFVDKTMSIIIVVKKKKNEIVDNHIKTRWINLYPQDDTGDDSDLQVLMFQSSNFHDRLVW